MSTLDIRKLSIAQGQANPNSKLLKLWEQHESRAAQDTRNLNAQSQREPEPNMERFSDHLAEHLAEEAKKAKAVERNPLTRLKNLINKRNAAIQNAPFEFEAVYGNGNHTVAVPMHVSKPRKLVEVSDSLTQLELADAKKKEKFGMDGLEYTLE